MRRFAFVLVSVGLVFTACSTPKIENYELSSYNLKEGNYQYVAEIQIAGKVNLGALETLTDSSNDNGLGNIDINVTADISYEVTKQGANNVIKSTLSNFNGKLPLGVDFPKQSVTYEIVVDPEGNVVRSAGAGLLTAIPGLAGTFTFNCPPLPDKPTQDGAAWTSKVEFPFGDGKNPLKAKNQLKDSEQNGQQVAQITANVDQSFSTTKRLGDVMELLGITQLAAIANMKGNVEGQLNLASTCLLSIPDQQVVESTRKGTVQLTISVDLQRGGLAAEAAKLLGGIVADLTIETSMKPK